MHDEERREQPRKSSGENSPTAGKDYAHRLNTLQAVWWKRLLHVQALWHAHIRHLKLGRALDVGCGNGRILTQLDPRSIGVDHNPFLVQSAREAGCDAYTSDQFFADAALAAPSSFDSMVMSHVIEHLTASEARELIRLYLPMIKPGGRLAFFTPQERGYRSDATHVSFTDFRMLRELTDELGAVTLKQYSFPFPRPVGKVFTYNEFVHIARLPIAA